MDIFHDFGYKLMSSIKQHYIKANMDIFFVTCVYSLTENSMQVKRKISIHHSKIRSAHLVYSSIQSCLTSEFITGLRLVVKFNFVLVKCFVQHPENQCICSNSFLWIEFSYLVAERNQKQIGTYSNSLKRIPKTLRARIK